LLYAFIVYSLTTAAFSCTSTKILHIAYQQAGVIVFLLQIKNKLRPIEAENP